MAKPILAWVQAAALAVAILATRPARGDQPATKPGVPFQPEIDVAPTAGEDRDGDQRNLQAAIDRLGNASGGTVRITPGRYVLRAALTLRSNVRVVGVPDRTILVSCDGAAVPLTEDAQHGQRQIAVKNADAFRAGDGVAIKDDRSPAAFAVTTTTLAEAVGPGAYRLSAPLIQDYAVARHATLLHAFPVVGGWNVGGASVEGLTIDGNRARAEYLDGCRGAGIYLYACQGVTIRHCTVRNCRGDGISFQWASHDVTVEDCLVEKCGGFGLHPGSDSHDSIVRENRSIGNGGPGLFVCEDVKHVVFEKNELRGNLGPGISIGCKDTDNLFRENSIEGNGRTGILFRDDGGEPKGAHRNTFEKNTILDNGSPGTSGRPSACITILGTHRNLVLRNNTIGNSQPGGPATVGVLIDNAPDLIIDANQFRNLKAETAAAPRDAAPANPPGQPLAAPVAQPIVPPATQAAVHHPNLLLNREEIEEVKRKITTQPWAAALLDRLKRESEGHGGSVDGIRNSALLYELTGADRYADYARRRLIDDARSQLPQYEKPDIATQPDFGMFNAWGLVAWGYDLVYDTLSPQERDLVERYLRTGCQVVIEELKHTSTTPNLVFGVHFNIGLVGYCLGDQRFIDWALHDDGGTYGLHKGGFYPVLDSMIRDTYFWGEAPIYALHYDVHGMLSLAEAARHYDGSDLYHYVSKQSGGSIKGLIDGYLRLAYPAERTGVGNGSIRMATFGDGSTSYFPDGTLQDTFLVNPVSAPPTPGVLSGELELAYKRYHDPAYAWLISLNPRRDTYVDYGRAVLGYAALTHGEPLPATPAPPPAPSGVYPGLGFAMLRADETPEYWRSGSLAALVMEGKLVGHGHKDYYSLGLHGKGRLIYPELNVIQYEPTWLNWTHESIAHNTLVVDRQSASPGPFTTKHEFDDAVKYFSITGSPYESEQQTRAMLLTREYLADFFHAEDLGRPARPRTFDWALHGLGRLYPGNPSAYRPTNDLLPSYWWIDNERSRRTDATFQADWIQRSAGVIPGRQAFGPEWFQQQVGVRMTMLGAPGAQVYAGDGPLCDGPPYSHIDGDPEGTCPMLVVRRESPATTFAAVHEPYEGHPQIADIRQLAGDGGAIAVRIAAPAYVDYLLAAFDDGQHTLSVADGQSFVFADFGYLRFSGWQLVMCGKVQGFRVKQTAAAVDLKATLNGKSTDLHGTGGFVQWGEVAQSPETNPAAAADEPKLANERAASLHAWFSPQEAHLSRGGKREVQLHLRCVGAGQVKGRLRVESPEGVHADPGAIDIAPLGEGEDRVVTLAVRADKTASQALRAIRLVPDEGLHAASCELPVSVGVVITEDRRRPMGAEYVVRAPGYTMKVDERSGVSFSLLDAEGRRRCGRIHNTNFVHGIPGVELDGKWLYDFATPCSFIWPAENALTIGCGQLYDSAGLRLTYRFYEDRIAIAVVPPTNPTKAPTMWLGTFEGIEPPRHNGKPDQPTDQPIVADRFFFPHPVYREGLLLTTPPQTPLTFRGTAVSFPIRRDQEIGIQFVPESEAGIK